MIGFLRRRRNPDLPPWGLYGPTPRMRPCGKIPQEEAMRATSQIRSVSDNPALTAALAEQAAATRYDDLPDDIRALTRQCVLDWLAVTLPGSRDELSRILIDEAAEQGGKPVATLIGHPMKTSTQQAALVNGTASHALDYDDVNLTLSGHPTVPLVASLLALAEARGSSGKEFMAAFVAGYETICRVGALVAPGHYARGFHATATVGSFGAAAACARLLGLDAEKTAIALGIAGTQAAGLKSMFGTMCKPLHAGKAAQNGLIGATLAARGFTSRADVLECPQGFAATQSPDFHLDRALADPPHGYHLRDNLFKYHAACYLTHAPIESGRKIRAQGVDPAAIREVVLKVDSGASKVCHILAPRTGLEAKFSLRLTSALALSGIDTAGLETYSERIANDPAIVALRDKVSVDFQQGYPHAAAEMKVTLADGRVVEARHDAGVPAADVAAQGTRIAVKFKSLATPVLGVSRSAQLADAVASLDTLPSLADLTRHCVPA
jgi:2-methylcitrate dehydratase PrpD